MCSQFVMVTKKPRLKPILSSVIIERLQIDIKEYTFYGEHNSGHNYQLTVIDHFSCFPWAFPQITKSAAEVSSNLMKLFLVFGPPKILHSDNGGEFVNELINKISGLFNIQLAHGKAYNPREQGKVEKLNGTIATIVSKLMFERKTQRWIDLIDEVLYSIRVTVSHQKDTF